jgi:LacI family repressor for deo operon, udp, cdd, tsx, nupC, and nupG
MATIRDMATALGVSTATVSRAFGSPGRISARTRQRILRKAEELGYRANIHARHLPKGGGGVATIGFFHPSLVRGEPDYFVAEILLGISETAAARGMPLQIHPLPPDAGGDDPLVSRSRDMLLDGSLGGMIVYAGSAAAAGLAAAAERAGLPCLAIGGGEEAGTQRITYGREAGAEQAGRYLCNIGRRRPAYVGGLDDAGKLRGFRTGLGTKLAAGLRHDPGGCAFADGVRAAERLLAGSAAPDAVFCANDVLALGFMHEALRRGCRIPAEVAVVGCDDVSFARFVTPALTTVRFHEYEIGRTAVVALARRMAGEQVGVMAIPSELIVRESA